MKRPRIEIPVTFFMIIILAVVGYSGHLVYQSLSQIVNSIHKETRPDLKLLVIKEIDSELSQVENTVRLFTLSDDRSYLRNYQNLNQSIEEKLTELTTFPIDEEETGVYIDSMQLLANEKLELWKDILNLHQSKADASETFSEYFQKLDTTVVKKDTIYFEEEVVAEAPKKKGFLRKIFGKKEKEPEVVVKPKTIVVDNSAEQEKLRSDVEAIEAEIARNTQIMAVRETALMEKNLEVSDLLTKIILELERREQLNLLNKTEEADRLASITYERLALFTIAAAILIIIVLLLFFRDLKKSRSYQRILKKAKNEAEQLARAKELFVATVSHEMRNPANVIFGLTEQLLSRPHDAKTQKDIEVIHKSTDHLINLVNDTFDFSKIENQKLQLEPIDFLLDELLDEVIIYNQANATQKGIDLILEKNDTAGLVIYSDPVRLKQILVNLLTNAVKFTNRGSVTLNVKRQDYGNEVNLSIEVIDTGIGIPKESYQLIFNDFVQLETDVSQKAKGTGLGLYIVKRLVDLLNGEITVESEINKGTTFKIVIPFIKGNATKLQALKTGIVIPDYFKELSILIVDDEEFNRHLIKNIFNEWQLNFQEVENGKEAIDLLEQQQFDLVLMDIRMPVMNGFEAIENIRLKNYPAKVIAVTADIKENQIQEYKDAGFDNFLHKPYTEIELLEKIDETMSGEGFKEKNGKKVTFEPSITLEDLERMSNGDEAFMREMVSIFINSNESSVHSIQDNLKEQNWQMIGDLAHKMAAPAKHMNITELYDRIKKIQHLAEEEKNSGEFEREFSALKEEVTIVNDYLARLMENV